MFSQMKSRTKPVLQLAAVGLGLFGVMSFASLMGVFEAADLSILDSFFALRGSSKEMETRILLVTIDDEDIELMREGLMSDEMLAKVIIQLNRHEPAGIGIARYRKVPGALETESLGNVFETIPNLVSLEQFVGEGSAENSTLASSSRIAAADLVVDDDGVVRRGLLSVIEPDGEVRQGFAATLALAYLEDWDIRPVPLDDLGLSLQLGQSRIARFKKHDGGYVNAAADGYQVLMNYRRDHRQFESVSVTTVLAGELIEAQVRDRIVLVGSTAMSGTDFLYTPLSDGRQIPSVYVHAQLLSQLLRVALDGQPFLKTLPGYGQGGWVLFCILASIAASRPMVHRQSLTSGMSAWQLTGAGFGVSSGVIVVSYGLFLVGWWLPLVLPLALVMAVTATSLMYLQQQLQKLAAIDELTQVASRGYFEQYLDKAMAMESSLSLIVCDVDYLKAFEAYYGHSASDVCLQEVARAIELAVRDSDLVARYGSDEFAVMLPDTTPEMCAEIAERIQHQVRQLEIVNEKSSVSEWITLSYGSVNLAAEVSLSSLCLVEHANKALSEAKQAGRNRIVVSQWNNPDDDPLTIEPA